MRRMTPENKHHTCGGLRLLPLIVTIGMQLQARACTPTHQACTSPAAEGARHSEGTFCTSQYQLELLVKYQPGPGVRPDYGVGLSAVQWQC